jgi:hypothetical protein
MSKKLKITSLIFLILIGIMTMALLSVQRSLIFYPEKLASNYQYQFRTSFQEVTYVPEPNIQINAILFKKAKPRGVIFYFHGNAGSLSSWGHIGDMLASYNYDVLIWDYRGYGKSSGEVTEENIFGDSEFIYNELKKNYDEDNIILFGRSIGTGPATYLSSKFKPKAVVIETPFYNLTELAKIHLPMIPSFLLQFKFENMEYLKKYKGPVYIVHGTEDVIIPFSQSEKLSENLTTVKDFTKVPGGHHNDLESFKEHGEFLDKILL